MATTSLSSSWSAPPDAPPLSVLEARGADAGVQGFMAAVLPLVLSRPQPSEASEQLQVAPCELAVEWPKHQPLRCQQLKLEIASSARHVELFIDGVRRSLLGEDEAGEVYLGTFRGAKATPSAAAAGAAQLFSVEEEFLQRDAKTNILKEVHRLRVKFVSLTGDKSALQLQTFRCAFVPLQPPRAQVPVAPPLAFAMPFSASTSDQPTHPTTNSVAEQFAGLGIATGGAAGSPVGGLETQVLMQGFQQMLEREMEAKIMKAVDEKLARLSQRLAFSEQRLIQLHQQADASNTQVRASLEQLQHQFASLEAHVKQQQQQLSTRSSDDAAEQSDE